jgi:hypothetical protein
MAEESHTNFLVGKPEGKNHSENLDIGEKKILEWILVKYGGKVWTGYIWIGTGTSGGLL